MPLQQLVMNDLIELRPLLLQMKDQFTTIQMYIFSLFIIEKMTEMVGVHVVLEDALVQVITMAHNANL
jgi:hypothetical protein